MNSIIGEWLVKCTAGLFVIILVRAFVRMKGLPPGPWGVPILGYLPWIDPKRPYLTLTALSRKYGPIYSVQLGPITAVVITDPTTLKEAFTREEFAGRANLFLTHGIMDGNGIIASEGEKWRELRRLSHTFLKKMGAVKIGSKRNSMESRIIEGVNETVDILRSYSSRSVDSGDILLHCIGNMMNRMMFGVSFGMDDPFWKKIRQLTVEGAELMGVAGPLNFFPILRFFPPFKEAYAMIKNGQKMTHETYGEIARTRTTSSENLVKFLTDEMKSGNGKYLDDAQIMYVLCDLFGAGTETSVTTLRWLFLYLAVHPECQDKLLAELKGVMKDRLEPRLDDVPFMPYLQACFIETLRVNPILPLGARSRFPHGSLITSTLNGYKIPKGSLIIPLQWAMHTDERVWENPEKFTPERFIDSEGKFIRNHEYLIPFQSGKRVCIGEEMARMMNSLFIAGIIRRFSVTLADESDKEKALAGICGLTLTAGEHKLAFREREM